jgi:hypothetical protein
LDLDLNDQTTDASSDNGFIFKEINKNENRKWKKNPVIGNVNNPIYPLLSTWITTLTDPEALSE